MKKLATIVAASALTLGLAGCGGGNDAEKTVESFGQALKDKDFKTVCDTNDPELVKTIEAGSPDGQSCADAMKASEDELTGDIGEDDEINIVKSEIAEDEKTATVTVKNKDDKEQDIKLKKVDDDWKITY